MSENHRNQGSVETGSHDRPSNADLIAGDDDQGIVHICFATVSWHVEIVISVELKLCKNIHLVMLCE